MKVTLGWLKEYVDIDLPADELARMLTMAGNEVEGIQVIGAEWDNIVVGRLVEINPHPDADRLRLATVDLGREKQTVVCGAPNLRTGDKIAFAYVGASLVDGHSGQRARLKKARIRGVESSGMVCSEKELGISDSHEGIMVLPAEAGVGTPLDSYLGDTIIDLTVTPNRPDCLSVIGIAREAAALTGKKPHIDEVSYEEPGNDIKQQISVAIAAPDLCPRYCASLVTGVTVGESPLWLQRRLLACGMRPINNVVDITNYVMLEYGQPLHAFDYERIQGSEIIVRRASPGENITSLDGIERTLTGNMLVIADAGRAVAIAGVMGGANSEVTPGTTSILLEAASFNPASIHYTGSTLRLPSEACMRFERGIRPELTLPAIKKATQLLAQLAGGQAARGLIDEYPGRKETETILVSLSKVKQILGVEISVERIVSVLTSLGFSCEPDAQGVRVHTPYWRSDIHLEVDLIEEVARIIGYDNLPTTMLSQSIPKQDPEPILTLKRKIGEALAGYGFQELITYSLISMEMLNRLLPESGTFTPVPLQLVNPMTEEQEYLRPNLRANLLLALELNRRHEDGALRVFELGKIYVPRTGDLPEEPEVLCGLLAGTRREKSWLGAEEPFDFYDVKGLVESLMCGLGVEIKFQPGSNVSLHPRKQAAILAGDTNLGVLGELHPRVAAAFEITETVYLFEIDLSRLVTFTVGHKVYKPVPRFPAIIRDMALVVDVTVSRQQIEEIVKSYALVSEVKIFDIYSGEQVPAGKKSMAYRIIYQSPSHTLTDDEANKVQQQIMDRLVKETGASLRA